MRALTVIPLQAGSAAVIEMPDPEPGPAELLEAMISPVPLDDFATAVAKQPGDVKVVLEL